MPAAGLGEHVSAQHGCAVPVGGAVAATVARLLAARGADALVDVVALLRRAVDADEVALRGADAVTVLARAGRPGPVDGTGRRRMLDAPLRCAGRLVGVLTATTRDDLTAERAGTLGEAADVLALFLDAPVRAERADAARAVLDEEAERAQAAAACEERVGAALVTVRYAAARVSAGEAGPEILDDPVQVAQEALRDVVRGLRAHALDAGLRMALRRLAARDAHDRADDGFRALDLDLDADDAALDALPPAVAVTVQRVAEAALRGVTGPARLVAGCPGSEVKLRVESADTAYDASELQRWSRRASALGGALRLRPDGVELSLPAQPVRPTPSAPEGRHDDGSDL